MCLRFLLLGLECYYLIGPVNTSHGDRSGRLPIDTFHLEQWLGNLFSENGCLNKSMMVGLGIVFAALNRFLVISTQNCRPLFRYQDHISLTKKSLSFSFSLSE